MKLGFYLRLARDNIRKNYRFYVPAILSGAGLIACFFIVFTLYSDERLKQVEGGDYIPVFMGIGVAVIALLSVILILYINSFLMKQRKREYGLYNVLGMEKRHVGKLMFFESLFSNGLSVVIGIPLGILFYKLCSLLICRLLHAEVVIGFYFIKFGNIAVTALLFAGIYLFAFFVNRIGLSRLKPVELLVSRKEGEKEPKVKGILLVLGVLSLGTGYALAVSVKEPLQALSLFFLAVFLVILGTYCLFTVGSIFVLKCLRKNRKYYYDKKHMSSVSGLLYRMKQNAVGLASICILATGVLIMISSTVSLYAGESEAVRKNFPDDMYVNAQYFTTDGISKNPDPEDEERILRETAATKELQIEALKIQKFFSVTYTYDKGHFGTDVTETNGKHPVMFIFITRGNYESLTGESLNLAGNEIALTKIVTIPSVNLSLPGSITLHGKNYEVKERPLLFPISADGISSGLIETYGIVTADEKTFLELFEAQKADYKENASCLISRFAVSFRDKEAAEQKIGEFQEELDKKLTEEMREQPDFERSVNVFDNVWDAKTSVIGMYGALLFLGIILGLVCMFATVLIIYYKQISEGYEDRDRYQVMKKVGMSDDEIRSTIRSQTLTVFFLPLITAGLHTAFAFPMVLKLLKILMLPNTGLFVVCSLITFVVFALIYVIIYSLTARTYYRIVR